MTDLSTPPSTNVWWCCVAKGILIVCEGQTAMKAFYENPALFNGMMFSDCKNWSIIQEVRGNIYG